MEIHLGTAATFLLVEPEAFEGVRRIAQKVAEDIFTVTGVRPEITDTMPAEGQVILCATVAHSSMAQALTAAKKLAPIEGKREVYQIRYVQYSSRDILAICGSDKRGTIYGMFSLSEYIGVSPLCFWGDVQPVRRDTVILGRDIETVSKEPSVKYRGFFINDEWPCFGTWSEQRFGDVNAQCYDTIFEFLLRMKGNYLWPAMWKASFPLDGPGSANEELADLYGVVMGYSHHEPCLRASEEWDKVRGENSQYGNEWNFYTNEQGLLRYWEDALKRSGKYENIITIGMRGERDTSMLGENATLEENVELLKRIIRKQREMIRQYVPRQATQMLALYKEVERYFYGDADVEGLRGWHELDDVLFMLCEDNHGHLRTVPPQAMREHPGGWGMYYHFDYHGGPISYEWVDSTPLAQTWEQMTQAWDYGIRDLWIVNVGDLKFHEVPLTYFLAMAYDFDKWGSSNLHSPQQYMQQWTAKTFPEEAALQPEIAAVFRDYIRMNSIRRPEALNSGIYHPCHYGEARRMIAMAEDIEARSRAVYDVLSPDARDAYYSMIHYPAMASAALVKMHLYGGINQHYAAQGKVVANRYADLTEECIRRDQTLAEEFAAFRDGKWDGMQLAPHIGFTKWNEDDCRYPVIHRVSPVGKAMMKVSRADRPQVATKNYGAPMTLSVPDFCSAGVTEAVIEVANGGCKPFSFTVFPRDGVMPRWLRIEPTSGTVTDQVAVRLICDRDKLPEQTEQVVLHVSDGEAVAAVSVSGKATPTDGLAPMTFLPQNGVISMLAHHYSSRRDVPGAGFFPIEDYGKYGTGMKVLPSTASFPADARKPSLTYTFRIDEPGKYCVEILTAPSNPIHIADRVNLFLEAEHEKQVLELIGTDFRAGENSDPAWAAGVLNQIHSSRTVFTFPAGVNSLTIGAMEPGVVLEKILIYQDAPVPSYLGPEESEYIKQGD